MANPESKATDRELLAEVLAELEREVIERATAALKASRGGR